MGDGRRKRTRWWWKNRRLTATAGEDCSTDKALIQLHHFWPHKLSAAGPFPADASATAAAAASHIRFLVMPTIPFLQLQRRSEKRRSL